jgi:hypothetical protein
MGYGNMKLRLHDLRRVWGVRETGTKAIVREGRVSLLGSIVNVGVVWRIVPKSY